VTDALIAAVFAHPDDETFAVAGTIVHYAARGRCVLFCATDGDAGRSSGVPVSSREELGQLRRHELLTAARLIGFETTELGGYPDGALARADGDELVTRIVEFLRAHRPRIVLTFGPEGGPNTHVDHRAISRAATAAFFLAGVSTYAPASLPVHRPERLYYQTWDEPAAGGFVVAHGQPVTARIEMAAHRETKRAAFLAHVTQRQLEDKFMGAALGDEELYFLAAGIPQPRAIITDLFEGLDA
jgi:LmbE family N-acetylglucosaminyl deacetylase